MIRLKLLSRPECHLCDAMQREVDALLGTEPREWDVVDVDVRLRLLRAAGASDRR